MNSYTIVITTHQRAAFLGRAIQSVRIQSHSDVRIIVVSDFPCPATKAVADAALRGTDIFLQRCGNPGPAESRNIGIRLVESDFVVFLDDDDALHPSYLTNVDCHLTGEDVVYTDFYSVLEQPDGSSYSAVAAERRSLGANDITSIYIKNFIPQSCIVYPVKALIGCWNDPSLSLEDWDFILNVMNGCLFRHAAIDGPLIYTRSTVDNRGRANNSRLEDAYLRIYKRWPAPSHTLKMARQSFLRQNGLQASLSDL